MDGMFMCAIHKQYAWGSLAFCNQVVQDRQSPKLSSVTTEVVENRTFSGEAAKFQSSDHQTAPIHASSLRAEVFLCNSFLTGLTLHADPRCKITRRSRKAMVTAPVSQLGRTGNIWFFSWREEESHSHIQTAAESPRTAKSILRCGFSFGGPEAAVISCWLWRCYS